MTLPKKTQPLFLIASKSGLYVITCIPKNKHYVGESKTVRGRLNNHKTLLRQGIHPNRALQTDFNTYGESCFQFQKLLFGNGVPLPQRQNLETLILSTLPPDQRYNVYVSRFTRPSELNPFFNKTHTREARYAQGAARRGQVSPFAGQTQPEWVKDRVRQENAGKSDRRKPVMIDGIYYESVSQASALTGLARRLIRQRCQSQEPRFTAYQWVEKDLSEKDENIAS